MLKSFLTIAISVVVSLMILSSMTACSVSPETLRNQATDAREIADKAGTLAEQITQILEDYNAGKIEEGAVAGMIRAAILGVNADWVVNFDNAVAIAGDIRTGATAFVMQIPDLQANLHERADNLDQLADENQSGWVNLVGLVVEWGAVIFGAGGIAAGIRQTIKAVQAGKDAESLARGVSTGARSGY